MKPIEFGPHLMILLAISSCSTAPIKSGYFDASGNAIPHLTPTYHRVEKVFSGHCPRSITVARHPQPHSEFKTQSSTVVLGTEASGPRETVVLAHETAHLCLAQMSRGASNTELYRFYDEGFASIVGGDYSRDYKKRSLATAAKKAKNGEVSFGRVQKWSTYFGDPPKANYEAYDVGSSFIFFVLDTYNADHLFAFFRATGRESSLEAACQTAFGVGARVVEKKWIEYLQGFNP